MKIKNIKNNIKKKISLQKIYIEGDENHLKITAIGDIFQNMSSLKRQKSIYSCLTKYFEKKRIHAVTIHAYTISEWKNI